jgi:hypothetical protein
VETPVATLLDQLTFRAANLGSKFHREVRWDGGWMRRWFGWPLAPIGMVSQIDPETPVLAAKASRSATMFVDGAMTSA